MDTQSIREKLMGRVQLIERRNDNNESVIHCFSALGQSGVTEADVAPYLSTTIMRSGTGFRP